MFCSFTLAFQSLNPHVTEVYGVTLTMFTPGQQVITRNKNNPLSKIKIKIKSREMSSQLLLRLVLNFDIFLYT